MSRHITIAIPDDMAHCEDDLRYFVETMVRKLHLNRHKGYAEDLTMLQAWNNCFRELGEAAYSICLHDQMAVMVETTDVANSAFLLALTAIRQTRPAFNMERSNYCVSLPELDLSELHDIRLLDRQGHDNDREDASPPPPRPGPSAELWGKV